MKKNPDKKEFKFWIKTKKWFKKTKSKLRSFFQTLSAWCKTRYHNIIYNTQKSKWFQRGINPLIWPYIILMILLIVVSLLIILLYSFIQPTGNSLVFEFNFANFAAFFSQQAFVVSLFLSLGYALIAAIIAIIIAYPVAYVMAFCKSKLLSKNIWILVTLPIWINMLLKIIGLQTLFHMIAPGLLGTPVSIVIGMVYAFIPFVILPIYNSLDKIDHSLIEASRDLGANGFTTFWKVIFRQSIPGVIAGGTLLLVQAATSLLIVKFMGNGQISMIVEVIETYFFKGGNFGLGAAISVVLAVIVFIIIIVSNWMSKVFETKRGKRNEKLS
ncbi:spermidine/putrescine ABC transporter permease [Spiroplasma eriocheiris]|uniref:Spermidine/putrescine ABC transporter permease n=1 Tax=Spiroplasma eriocheiris TaxID=315358 RepID=A0A0H3XLS7_9MOLU|nr:spermidine/putrescine ABC transporter permease [Spiroplasma eriocheiris]AHF57286.1 ABC-type spermidine/putrescine transport system permease protein [Spiroplasma eriocheiris CCTCC M 207170]AKM53747.1 spermidine/putrescine ABC transporter permease [Spiroplasma eriocheiris]